MWFFIPVLAIGGYWYYTKEETEKAILREKAAAADERAKASSTSVVMLKTAIKSDQDNRARLTEGPVIEVTPVKGLFSRY